ncbi:hypothetical protein [Porphyromonas endodontalis]|uniref:hypothetical protein n=1 Tax=Porphyromonas endodontalis TaxID=28124 RepID=UPI0028E7A506|nr:hypothetical protein [Porphyromonas endodontalis]
MKRLRIELEDGTVISYRYKTVEQLKSLLPSSGIKIGQNVQLGDHIYLSDNVEIGDNCILGDYVNIGGDVVIGDNVRVGREVTVESDVWIASGTIIPPCTSVTVE